MFCVLLNFIKVVSHYTCHSACLFHSALCELYICSYGLLIFTGLDYSDFPGGSDSKESACNAGDPGSTPGLGRSLGEGNGYPLQYYGLENSKEPGRLWGRKDLDTTEQLSLSSEY